MATPTTSSSFYPQDILNSDSLDNPFSSLHELFPGLSQLTRGQSPSHTQSNVSASNSALGLSHLNYFFTPSSISSFNPPAYSFWQQSPQDIKPLPQSYWPLLDSQSPLQIVEPPENPPSEFNRLTEIQKKRLKEKSEQEFGEDEKVCTELLDKTAEMFDKVTGNGNGNKMNVRLNVLEGLLSSMEGEGTTAKANALRQAIRRNKVDMADTPSKSLDLMRRVFQKEITEELRQIIDRHLRTTFSPAIENLRRNGHEVTESDMSQVARSILDAAKDPFGGNTRKIINRKRGGRDMDMDTDMEDEIASKRRFESEDESDGSVLSFTTINEKKRRRPRSKKDEEAILNDMSVVTVADTLKWNPDRFTPNSRFLFAARVAATINIPTSLFFSKYPRFFRYVCEEEDKNDLYDAGRLSRLTGRSILVLLEDSFDILGHSPEIERYSFPINENVLMRLRGRAQRVYESLCQRLQSTPSSNAIHSVSALFPFTHSPVMSFPVG